MKYKTLLSSLSLLFGIALIYYTGFLAFTMSMNIFGNKISNESFSPNNWVSFASRLKEVARIYDEDGFEIPVRLKFSYADTIVRATGKMYPEYTRNEKVDKMGWSSEYGKSLKEWEAKVKTRFDTIYSIDTVVTRALVSKMEESQIVDKNNMNMLFNRNRFDLYTNEHFRFLKTNVNVKPKTTTQYFLLFSRSNLKIIFYIFLFYQLLRITRILKSNFSFTKNIFRRINLIGWAFLFYSILMLIIDVILRSLYDSISIRSMSTVVNQIDSLYVFMYSRLDFNFEVFSAGLLLIIFSYLMKRSSKIEEDYSLMV